MDQHLISTINRLQDALASLGASSSPIDLPQITVLGSQSSGKSSVLENIVGRDFLPRGSGIVTRRPLVLQLINRRSKTAAGNDSTKRTNETNTDEWGEFLHIPDKKFYEFDEIRQEIVRETEKTTGKNAGISPIPINLRIYSPHVLTLTLVDLPGLTKVPVGDQPRDIEKQIKDMVLKYIQKPNAIILSVNAANQDLANSDGLKLAQEVDPEGSRTIGVLTKIDLMDQGTDVIDILAGRIIPLRYGYIPVINRGQRDIDTNKSIQAALDSERKFFESHPSYMSKAQYCGTPYLARKLNGILLQHIKATLPEIKMKIESSLAKYKAELAALGDERMGNPSSIVLNTITEFCNEYRAVLDGEGTELSSQELSGGARVSFVFHEIYKNGVNALDPFDEIKEVDIRTILYNSSGTSPSLFVGTQAFESLVKKQIRRFGEPSLKCITLIFDELVRILSQIVSKTKYNRYPVLKEQLLQVVIAFLRKSLIPTNTFVGNLIEMEECYINTAHPDLLKGSQAMAIVQEKFHPVKPIQVDKSGKPLPNQQQQSQPPQDDSITGIFSNFFSSKSKRRLAAMEPPPAVLRATGAMGDREAMEVEVIKLLIQSYFNIVKRTVSDTVPKAIMLKLIQFSKEEMQKELLEQLYKAEVLETLASESESTVQRRKECHNMIEVLKNANEIVSSV